MSQTEQQAWDMAEAIAAAYVRARNPTVQAPIVARRPTIPHLFSVRMTPTAVLVHEGRVIEARGVPALRAYLDSSQLLDGPLPDVLDVQHLLHALDVWPPTQRHDRVEPDSYWLAGRDHPLLYPRLERHGTRTELHLFYVLGSGRGATPDPDENIRVAEWILVLEPGTDPQWTRVGRVFSRERSAWVK